LTSGGTYATLRDVRTGIQGDLVETGDGPHVARQATQADSSAERRLKSKNLIWRLKTAFPSMADVTAGAFVIAWHHDRCSCIAAIVAGANAKAEHRLH